MESKMSSAFKNGSSRSKPEGLSQPEYRRHLPAQNRILIESRNCWRLAHADRFAFLIDADAYFAALYEAVTRAQQCVMIVGWDFDRRINLLRDRRNGEYPVILGDLFMSVLSRRPELNIYILEWDYSIVYMFERELFARFRAIRSHPRLHFRLDGNHPLGGCHHQKIVVIDDALAFCGGIDLAQQRWDTRSHKPHDPRRLNPQGQLYPPYHDVQVAVDGAAAAALGELVRERWLRATSRRIPPAQPAAADPWPPDVIPDIREVEVGIARTEPAYRGRKEVREIETLYRDCILAARKYIYIENQYLTSTAVGDALAKRLREKDGPEIVIALPYRRIGWREEYTMGLLRGRIVRELQREDEYHRLRIYYPHVEGLEKGCKNIHSKLMVADDSLVRIGSANLNNRSMGLDTECDLAIEASGNLQVERAIRLLRDRLFADHLGLEAEEVQQTIESEGSLIGAVEKLRLRVTGFSVKPLSPHLPEWLEKVVPVKLLLDPERAFSLGNPVRAFLPDESRRVSSQFLVGTLIALLLIFSMAGISHWTLSSFGPLKAALAQSMVSLLQVPALSSLILAIYVLGSMLLIPITLLVFISALLFEPLHGFLYAFLGSHLAAMVLFVVGRWAGYDLLNRCAGNRLGRLRGRMQRGDIKAVLGVRFFPVAPFTLVSLVAGASRIHSRDFLLGTLAGMTPGIAATVFLVHWMKIIFREPGFAKYMLIFNLAALVVPVLLLIIHFRIHRVHAGRKTDQTSQE
ncbi:MAG: hypothetical protein C4520_21450 [Candidatus Abyssobacteria bacterium SURF_5]|uniref:PLD phosphodiesterase domain-containing protein n=1 Tax=Abyssobacteria bacterium (strain SURF_5) TaxID=2093360 RepID=A0A3A4MVK4_ABYX5|nr:MAG: hypothetical protein C4520_21450 [Candidatus Abyssubacteria bacterium SURF_5]